MSGDLPPIQAETEPKQDETAGKETQALEQGNLDKLERGAEFLRVNKLRQSVGLIVVYGIWLLAVLAAILVIVVFLHYIIPARCHWVEADTISTLTKFILGTIVGALSTYIKPRIGIPRAHTSPPPDDPR